MVLRALRVHGSWLNQDEIEIGLFFAGNASPKRRIPALQDPAAESSRLESPDESQPNNQLEVYPHSRPTLKSYKRKSFTPS